MKKLDVLHIYYGTQGVSGLYLDEIYQTLKGYGFLQEVVVSFYYPFNYGKNFFFRYTDLASGVKNGKKRMVFRFFEYIYGLIRCYFLILRKRPAVVNYSLNSSFITDVIFFRLLRYTTKSKLVITCHDVLPLTETDSQKQSQIHTRKKIFSLADYLLVHNENSRKDLINHFKVANEKIIFHSFPLMNLQKLHSVVKLDKEYDFSMIGHLRKGKGLETLVEAWKMFHPKYPEANLLIAGNLPEKSSYDLTSLSNMNVEIRPNYLTDLEYFTFLKKTKTLIMPYNSGTNSGVVYNVLPMDVNIIYSDLEMFANNPLLDKSGMFQTQDAYSLEKKMISFYTEIHENRSSKIQTYKMEFDNEVVSTYKKIINE